VSSRTTDLIQGRWDAALSVVIGQLPVQPYPRKILTIVIDGPSRSIFTLYKGQRPNPANQLSRTEFGRANSYDSTIDGAPILVGAGEQAVGVWTGATVTSTSTGTATVTSQYGGGH